jgi:hypothetical protein
MLYFQTLPKISYPDGRGNKIVMTDLLTRVYLVSQLIKDPINYYSYEVKDGETPEIVADKYYGASENYWLVMLANQINDPQWDWPLSQYNFNAHIIDKYGSQENTQLIHHYEKILTTTNVLSNVSEVSRVQISQSEYNTLIVKSSQYTLPSGEQVVFTVDKAAISNYQYELELNESKRSISLINKNIAGDIQRQFRSLFGVFI